MSNPLQGTSDIWFTAFLMSKKIPISDYKKKEYGKVECFFVLSDEEWKKLKLEFDNSDAIMYKAYIQRIKDLAFTLACLFLY